jgi:hypothetical protein
VGVILGAVAVLTFPAVLFSNYCWYKWTPKERWPMVITATAIWWVPVTGLGLWLKVPAWEIVVAQVGCLTSAFLATMGLKFFWYRKAALGEKADLPLWQQEMLDDVEYSLDRQAEHVRAVSAGGIQIEKLIHRMEEHRTALAEDARQAEMYYRIAQQTLKDFENGVASSYLARRQQAETEMVREEAGGKNQGL